MTKAIAEIRIRQAVPSDAQKLTEISFAAKRYWRYPESYYETWKNELTITEEYIRTNHVFIAEIDGLIVGYYSMTCNPEDQLFGKVFVENGYWMEHIFLSTEHMRAGIGSLLVRHMKNLCIGLGIDLVKVFVDPMAEGFYKKIGARFIRMSESSIEGRVIPVYEIVMTAQERRP